MSYEAIICKIKDVKKHPNADRLNIGTASGYNVIVSKDTEEGTLGIYFPTDGQLSDEMCHENNLFSHSHLNKDTSKKGFFGDKKRVRTISLRQAKSEGFWSPLSILEWTKADLTSLKEGDLISELNGKSICNKYYTRATRQAQGKNQSKTSRNSLRKEQFIDFKEHWHTTKLRLMINFLPEGAVISLTEKLHGTSGRTGLIAPKIKKTWKTKLLSLIGIKQESKYKYVSGTRKVVLDTDVPENGFYKDTSFRKEIHKSIADIGLHPGETFYYEIVGYTDKRSPVMGNHTLTNPNLVKRYGTNMIYSYGCEQEAKIPYKIFVYRITHVLPDGTIYEVPYHQVVARCKELGLSYVPVLKEPFVYNNNQEELMALCERLSQGDSTLDSKHIREGVVIRVEAPGVDTHYKYKGFYFCELEGIMKNNDNYVDLEEVN
jgi:hypothetical protein